jgi:serine/threonine protein kinase
VFGRVTVTTVPPSGAEKARLLRRAQAVARLRHPNLVRLLPLPGGAGLEPVLGSARRLADFTLPAGTFKRFDLEQVLRLLLDVLSGLSALHEVVTDGQAFVHGAVSPHNIYVDEHGTARLVPILNAHVTNVAAAEAVGYAAPEALAGDMLHVQSDLFSVGVMLWEAIAGKRWRGRPVPIELSANLRWAEPLCRIAERATAAEPASRFGSALELSRAIEVAAAQQLSCVDSDAWQEEAPTPVFQPRLHLATLRTSTPPPAVLTIGQTDSPSSVPAMSEPPFVKRGGARVLVPVLALLTVALVSAALLRSPLGARGFAAAFPMAAATPPVAGATPPTAVEAPPVAVAAPPMAVEAPPVATPLPSEASSVAPASTSSANASAAPASQPSSRPSPPQVLAPPARPAQTKPRPDSDYGI